MLVMQSEGSAAKLLAAGTEVTSMPLRTGYAGPRRERRRSLAEPEVMG